MHVGNASSSFSVGIGKSTHVGPIQVLVCLYQITQRRV